jgi:hypothetical protein
VGQVLPVPLTGQALVQVDQEQVSGPQPILGWESRISRSSVVPERWQPTTKIGARVLAVSSPNGTVQARLGTNANSGPSLPVALDTG